MEFNALTAISPIDGRYQSKTAALQAYFSEFGLIRYRVLVEVEYLIALVESGISNLSDFPKGQYPALRAIYTNSRVHPLWSYFPRHQQYRYSTVIKRRH
jgi:adenylosuccinate lyase